MANNTDDHNKNFSFLLEENGSWHIAPAYDVTFIFNTNGTGPNIERRLSIGGKTSEIAKNDLLEFAKLNDIRDAEAVIDRVAEAIGNFARYAANLGVTQPWCSIAQKTLNECLTAFGYLEENKGSGTPFRDKYERTVSALSVAVNSKGHYEVTAVIDGNRH